MKERSNWNFEFLGRVAEAATSAIVGGTSAGLLFSYYLLKSRFSSGEENLIRNIKITSTVGVLHDCISEYICEIIKRGPSLNDGDFILLVSNSDLSERLIDIWAMRDNEVLEDFCKANEIVQEEFSMEVN
jgi:hypothetical protein